MKAIRILVKAVVWIVAIIVVALLALPLWFGPVVKTAANAAVPGIVKTDFHMGHIHLNPYTARFELRDMRLANPTGYPEKYAVTLGDITFDAATLSLMTDVIHVEEITAKDIFVSVVSGGENKVGNFTQIQYNVAGGKEKYEAAQAEKQRAADAEAEKIRLEEMQNPKAAEGEKAKVAEEEGPSKKIIIDRLHVSGLKVQLGIIPISIPLAIDLTDIGKDSGGVSFEEAWNQIWAGILQKAGMAGDQLKALGGMVGDGAKQASEAATKTAEATANATKAAGDAVNKAAERANKALDSLKKLWSFSSRFKVQGSRFYGEEESEDDGSACGDVGRGAQGGFRMAPQVFACEGRYSGD